MNNVTKIIMGAVAALAFTTTAASAKVVCNEDGDCWRVKTYREYPPEVKLRVYDDNWKWADGDRDRYRWREHDHDRHGYYRSGGVWVDLN